jgi:hypothetical protein
VADALTDVTLSNAVEGAIDAVGKLIEALGDVVDI